MEGDEQEGDVGREEVHVGEGAGQMDEPQSNEEPQEKGLTEKIAEPLSWPLRERADEPVAAAPESVEEKAEEEAEEKAEEKTEEEAARGLPPSFLVPEADEPEASADDGQGVASPTVVESVGMEPEEELEAPEPQKKRKPKRKMTAHKRADKGRKKSAKRASRKAPAKRSRKKRKRSRA